MAKSSQNSGIKIEFEKQDEDPALDAAETRSSVADHRRIARDAVHASCNAKASHWFQNSRVASAQEPIESAGRW
ncbi:hypothetical protein [Bradyrhizobium sp. ORS 111]|uniref:hypothetical protein n=1 Tax=Bradyrhizobium sp. ORS 111 TaxID=1685958 RepID=UPI00388EE5F2